MVSFLLALAMVVSLVFNATFIDLEVKAEEALPEIYDGREYQTPARDQGRSELCWAFSTIAGLEANAVKNLGADKDELDLSEYHLAYFTFAQRRDPLGLTNSDKVEITNPAYNFISNGGNPGYPLTTLTAGIGPVFESDAPMSSILNADGTVKDNAHNFSIDESLRRGRNVYEVENVYQFTINNTNYGVENRDDNRDAVKRAIKEYGAVVTAYYSYTEDATKYNNYYHKNQDGEVAYYQNDKLTYDHGIAIVGWNDNFSRDNFYSGLKPSKDGAWLAKNSWGTNTRFTDDRGYFWISYEDASFTPTFDGGDLNNAYAYELRIANQYKYNYQYDGGIIHEYKPIKTDAFNKDVKPERYANVFTSTGNQKLEAITVKTDMGGVTSGFDLKIYKNVNTIPTDGDLAYSQRIYVKNGFNTVRLSDAINIDNNEKFSVVLDDPRDEGWLVTSVCYDRDYFHKDSNIKCDNVTNAGESFVKFPGETDWSDLHNIRFYNFENGTSLCIKALMNDRDTHTHLWTYSVVEDELVATCENFGCEFSDGNIALSLNASDSVYAEGSGNKANLTGDSAAWISNIGELPIITYKGDNYNSKTPPVNAGEYTATISKEGATLTKGFTIKKSTPNAPNTPIALAPTAKTSTDGKVTGVDSSMQYSVDGGNNWTDVSGNEIRNLAAGTSIKIRIKETVNTNAGASKDLTIPGYKGSGSGSGSGFGGSSGGSLGGSSGGSSSTSISNNSVTISSDTSANINVQVSNNNVTVAKINESTINSIISNSSNTNEVKSVSIDLSKVNENITSVTITKDTAENIANVLSQEENIKENFSVKLPNVTITLDNKAVSAIAKKAKADEIRIVVENTTTEKLNDKQKDAIDKINKNEKTSVSQTFEAYIVSGTERITDFNGGTISVSKVDFKVPAGKNPKFYHVYYLSDNGDLVRLQTWYEEGALRFNTGRLY